MNKKVCCLYPAFFIIFLVALFFTLPFRLGLVFRDEETVQDSDFDLDVREISDEENGYLDLANLTGEEVSVEVDTKVVTNLSGETWDADFVKSTLSDYGYLAEAVEDAAAKPYFQDPATADPMNGDYMDGIPTWHVMHAVRLNNLKALALMKEGKEAEAFAQAYNAVILGQNMEESYCGFISLLISNSIKKTGIETLELLAKESKNTALLISYTEKLESAYFTDESIERAYKVEYHLMSSIMPLVAENPSELDPFIDSKLNDVEEWFYKIFRVVGFGYYYHPNETQSLYADFIRQRADPTGLFPQNPYKAYFTENAFGFALIESLTPRLSGKDKQNEIRLLIESTQRDMIVQAYKLEHEGAEPETNADLDPYLPEGVDVNITEYIMQE